MEATSSLLERMPHVTTTLSQLAQLVGGKLLCESTDNGLLITGAAALADVGQGQITLIDKVDRASQLIECKASAVIIPEGLEAVALPAIAVTDVHKAFSAVIKTFSP